MEGFSRYAKGALSFVVQDVAGVRKPLAVVALYSPPLTSRFNRNGKQWSQDVLDWVALEGVRLWRKYGFVAVGGDFNWRLGRMYGRRMLRVGTLVDGRGWPVAGISRQA